MEAYQKTWNGKKGIDKLRFEARGVTSPPSFFGFAVLVKDLTSSTLMFRAGLVPQTQNTSRKVDLSNGQRLASSLKVVHINQKK